jgi:hypothetical protein
MKKPHAGPEGWFLNPMAINVLVNTHILQKHVKFWVAFGVVCDFKQRKEDVGQELLEVIHQLVGLKNVTAKD